MLSASKNSIISRKSLLHVAPLALAPRTVQSTYASLSIPSPILTPQTNQTLVHSFFGNHDSFYSYLFTKLKSPPNLFEARRLHALLVTTGFFDAFNHDRVLGSQLVNVYVNFGCFNEALVVFDQLPHKGNLAWNAALRSFVETGQFIKAIDFFESMLGDGVVPDNFTYPLVLKACSGLNDLGRGRKVRDLISFNERGYKLKHNVFVQCALINMFGKCGSLVEAREVFDEMSVRDIASWSAMISGAVRNGEWLEAFRLFYNMRMEGLRPDSVIVATLVPVCGRVEGGKIGMALHSYAITSGFDCDLFVSNALIDLYCKSGDVNAAHALFGSMVYKDAVSWSSLIAGYSQNHLYRETLELYLEMKETGIRTNGIIAASVLPGLGKLKLLKQGKQMHSCMIKQHFECDAVVWSALIELYSNCGLLCEAERIFKPFSDQDISLFNSMISGYSLNNDFDSAFCAFRRIWNSLLRPNSITLLSILPICTRLGTLKLGKQIHGYVVRSGLDKIISVMNSVIDMYCRCGYLQLGITVLNQMIERNIVTYNTIISAYGAYGLGERALLVFEEIKELGIRPNQVTFVALLSACSHAGLLDRGWLIYNSMINDYNIIPVMEHYACVVDLFGRAGLLDDACRFIRDMPLEPDIDVLGSLLGACRLHKNLQLADILGRFILQKNIKDSGYHILLSNIYTSAEKWEDASKFRTVIKEKGLVKDPGSSWIQAGSNIHKLHAKDQLHPEFNKMGEIQENLSLEM